MTTTLTTANALIGCKVGNTYRIGTKIGSGSFGEIHKGKPLCNMKAKSTRLNVCINLGVDDRSGEEVAIKLEKATTRHPQLEYEYRVYKAIAGGIGIPRVRYFSTENNYNSMVMDKLGRKYIN